MSTRKWVPIIVGIVIFVVLVGAGLIGGLAYVVSKQVNVQNLPEGRGEEEFNRLVARFAGQTPFIELPGDDRDERSDMKVHHELETHGTGSIKTLHVAAWKPDEGKLVQVALPFWTLRLGGNHPIELHTGAGGAMILSVTPDQVDKRGPGLILTRRERDGTRLLIWTE
jgi:hypothetical protein